MEQETFTQRESVKVFDAGYLAAVAAFNQAQAFTGFFSCRVRFSTVMPPDGNASRSSLDDPAQAGGQGGRSRRLVGAAGTPFMIALPVDRKVTKVGCPDRGAQPR
jgi:hypothetical protein